MPTHLAPSGPMMMSRLLDAHRGAPVAADEVTALLIERGLLTANRTLSEAGRAAIGRIAPWLA